MLWNKGLTLEVLNQLNADNMAGLLGIRFTEIRENSLIATMEVCPKTMQPMGFLHGGASAVLAETLGSVASHALPDLKGTFMGLELNASHLRAGTPGLVKGVVSPIKIGRKVHVWQIDIYQNEKQICTSRLTTILVER